MTTRDPADVVGRHIEEYLPAGGGAPVLKQLMSEIEMWLFEHPVNGARAARGLHADHGPVAVGRRRGYRLRCRRSRVFARATMCSSTPLRATQRPGGGVIVMPDVPGSDAWHEAESLWLKPAVAQLRAGVISRLDLSAGARGFSVSARAILRFWRRRKPWWEWFA